MAKKLQNLKLKRRQHISSIARIAEFVNKTNDREIVETEFFEIKARFEKLPLVAKQFEAVQDEIEIITDFSVSEEEYRREFEDQYFSLHAKMQEIIHRFDKCSSSDSKPSQVISNATQLPVMNLPTFDGEYHRWPEFRDTFIALVDSNKALTNVQKFYHLRSCLRETVLDTIKSISVTNDNYKIAFQRLTDRYEREHLIAGNHVNAIINFPKILKESSSELRNLHNCLNNNLQLLKNIGIAVEHWDLLLIPIVASKVDNVTVREWEKLSISKKQVRFQELLNLLNERAEFLERMESNKACTKQHFEKQPNLNPKRFSTAVHVQSPTIQCDHCKGNHPVFKCASFLKLPITDRIKIVKDKGLCINCLRLSHTVERCTASKCRKCGKVHNTLLHFERNKSPAKTADPQAEESTTVATTQIQSKNTERRYEQAILPTALILVADTNDEWHNCRALLDSGAMSNFISREFHDKLKLGKEPIHCSVKGVGSSSLNIDYQTKITFTPRKGPKIRSQTNCLIIDKITSSIPLVTFEKNNLKIPKTLRLADPTFNKSNKIDILLGAAVFWDLLEDGSIKIPGTGMSLRNTKLGWIVGGIFLPQIRSTRRLNKSVNCVAINHAALENQIKKFWEVEEIGPSHIRSPEEQFCEESFLQTHQRDQDGRFIVKIPFKSNRTQLGRSRHLAIKRFRNLERKLNQNPRLQAEYNKILKEYISMGHMKEVDDKDEVETACYYIPHHAVIRNESLTTKIRIVFDASMSTTSGLSLNDIQYVGPTIQNDLFSILINFRLHKYVMSGDISKMYRMVWLNEEHKPYHRIFWRENGKDHIKCFELQTVTFGTASAPFLAIRCLHQVANENSGKHPEAAKIIRNNFYVDDIIYGADSIDNLLTIQHEVTTILSSAGFNLRKWVCNERKVYSQLILNPGLECNTLEFGDKEHKTLGIAWNTQADKITYSKVQVDEQPITKRIVLSELSKFFDPLGLIGPILVVGKFLMQKLWQKQISWDEALSSELAVRWLNFKTDLKQIKSLAIDRKVLLDGHKYFDIHGFCDASQKAYGACLYLRSKNERGFISSKLLCAKSRVAPLKTISLPRLELSAALLLARLVKKVLEQLEMKPNSIYYWSDSTITLAWIRGDPSRWQTFVANRVGEIQRLTDLNNWYHVSSSDNPADILSRGATVDQLIDSEAWWTGPTWLASNEIPFNRMWQGNLEIPEEKTLVHLNVTPTCELINRYSNYQTLQRITAYCFRFIENSKLPANKRASGEISVAELKVAEDALLRSMQREAFPDEYKVLQQSKPIGKGSRLQSLNPFLDQENIIRVGGRLDKTNQNFGTKHPVILAQGHQLTKLILKHIHEDNFHCGPTSLLSFVRQKFWPIDGRRLAGGVVRGCKICFLARPKPSTYLMGQLPACRVTQSFPFEHVGVDYAGPVLIKDRKTRNYKTLKAYVCLFVCMSTKAIHLECVSDLSTEAFVQCLKRFIGRRGKPGHIYSDNAKNFVGANAELKRIYAYIKQHFSEINKFLTNNEINWHFIPARSPSFGGIWEAGIKSVKSHLNKVSKNIKFDFEQLSTLLCQIEAILNSRPLTPLSNDPNDLTPLTPGHFLIGRSLNQHPEISHPSLIQTSRLKKYRVLETIFGQFWSRWSREYVNQLQLRTKWTRNTPKEHSSIQIGKMVVLKESANPFQWPLGRIVALHPGTDGIVRVVSIKVRDGIVKRGVNMICVLPDEFD